MASSLGHTLLRGGARVLIAKCWMRRAQLRSLGELPLTVGNRSANFSTTPDAVLCPLFPTVPVGPGRATAVFWSGRGGGIQAVHSGSERQASSSATRRRKTGSSTVGPASESEEDARRRFKLQALNEVIAKINADHGKGTVIPLDADVTLNDVEMFSSGVASLDVALGGGWPRGRVVEVFGQESTGKSTLALYAIAEIQKLGGTAVVIDAEHAMDMTYAKSLGIITEGLDRVIVVQPSSGEEAFSVADEFIRSGLVALVVVDSVSALVPQAELEGNVGEATIASLARLMSISLRRIAGTASKAGCTIMFLNQIRHKISPYGNPEYTSGGNALKYYASVRCELKKVEVHGKASQPTGFKCRAKVVKSKVYQPYKEAFFDMTFGLGIQQESALLEAGRDFGLVGQRGSYFDIDGQALQGREKAIAYLRENKDARETLESAIKEMMAGKKLPAAAFAGEHEEGSDSDDFGLEDAEEAVEGSGEWQGTEQRQY